MKVKELIHRLNSLSDIAKEKEIKVVCPNGLVVDPKLKYELINKYDPINNSQDNIKCYFITWG